MGTSIVHHGTTSIGVALFVNHQTTQEDMFKWADRATYRAKEAGRNAIRFHELKDGSAALLRRHSAKIDAIAGLVPGSNTANSAPTVFVG